MYKKEHQLTFEEIEKILAEEHESFGKDLYGKTIVARVTNAFEMAIARKYNEIWVRPDDGAKKPRHTMTVGRLKELDFDFD